MATKLLYTIGYEGINLDRFLRYLTTYHITLLVDIRDIAWSRKNGFSKKALASVLYEAGIEYLHLPELGSPPTARHAYHSSGDFNTFAKRYRKYIESQAPALNRILSLLAEGKTVCLMCFERAHNECHRSLVADALASISSDLLIKPLPVPGL